jgi:hypothetical protein
MHTFFIVMLTLALSAIIATFFAIIYSVQNKISREPSFEDKTLCEPLLPERESVSFRAGGGLYVIGVSSHSLLFILLATERGIPVTLVVSNDPESLELSFPRNIADFVKKHYKCESVHDMINVLPESVVVVPEDMLPSSHKTAIIVEARTMDDPFVMADKLCGQSDRVILIKRSC